MKRRNFIFLTSTAAAAIAIPVVCFKYYDIENKILLLFPQQLIHIWNFETVIATGLQYKKQYAKEINEEELVRLLLEDSPSKKELSQFIDKKIDEDYKTGAIVEVNGWLLSVTEARQCALFSLTQSK